jgi:benzoylformate decarboxylase
MIGTTHVIYRPLGMVGRTVLPDMRMLDELAQEILPTSKIALVVGSQIEEDQGWHQIISLAEQLNTDVYAKPLASRWVFPRSHLLLRGRLRPAQRPIADQLAAYDTVIMIGAPLFLYHT